MSGLSVASSKVYDGTTVAAVSGTPTLLASETVGAGTTSDGKPYSGDTVSISGTAAGTFASNNVATGIQVSYSGLSLTGAQAANYSLTFQSPGSANITQKALTIIGLSASNKVYDATTTATVSGIPTLRTSEAAGSGTTSDGQPYTGDTVSLSGSVTTAAFSNANAGSNKTVTVTGLSLSGANAGNYFIGAATTSATITAKALTMSGLSVAPSKVYDGTTAATVSGAATLLASEAAGAGTTSDGSPTAHREAETAKAHRG